MSNGAHATALMTRSDALRDYLDALLQEVPDEPDAPRQPIESAARIAPAETVREVAAPPVPLESADGEPATEAVAATEPTVTESADGPPAWATPDFQALLFQVNRLNLAVPLVWLHGVVPWDEHISAMPNQPSWCHGVLRYRGRNVSVIDTATLVLPVDRRPTVESDDAAGHILIVGDGSWGLACRTVGEVVRLMPDEVKWRSARGRRPWLAGTVLGRLCALMDTEAFADMLASGRCGASE